MSFILEIVQNIMTANNFVQNGLFAIMEVLRSSGRVQLSTLKIVETMGKFDRNALKMLFKMCSYFSIYPIPLRYSCRLNYV